MPGRSPCAASSSEGPDETLGSAGAACRDGGLRDDPGGGQRDAEGARQPAAGSGASRGAAARAGRVAGGAALARRGRAVVEERRRRAARGAPCLPRGPARAHRDGDRRIPPRRSRGRDIGRAAQPAQVIQRIFNGKEADMAVTTHPHDRRMHERRRNFYPSLLRAEGMKVSWGGIFGGVLVAIGLLLLLTALGVAVGISAAQPGETEMSGLGTGAGIWAGVALLLALFIGGLVSTRIGASSDGATGFFEGALVWVVSILLMLYFASSGVSMLAGGAFQMVGGAAQALGSVVQSQGVEVSGSVDQMIQRLKDPKTAQQIAAATGMQESEVQATLSET